MTNFPGPLTWFQEKLWRLKWLEFSLLFLCIDIMMLFDPSVRSSLGTARIISNFFFFPVGGLILWGGFKISALMLQFVPMLSWIPSKLAFANDKFLANFCREDIVFYKEKEY